MKPSILLAWALLAPAAIVRGADTAPPAHDLYVRGAFNGWGTDDKLAYRGHGVYETDIVVSPGNHAFKIGSSDWSDEWVADPAASVTVAPGRAYALAREAGAEDYLFARQTSTWRFTVDVADAAHPVLRVARVEMPAPPAAADPHAGARANADLAFATWDGKTETARFSTPDPDALLRTYAQSTTQQLRDPGPQSVTYAEDAGLPRLRSGNLAFDALFALAGHELRQDAVSHIRDGNYNGNAAIACDCFETGEKWHYVWTRDLSYAADLGIALLDPERVRNGLLFKLSPWRQGVGRDRSAALQIVQDTGSGGSWPVSTDRITWAFAAEDVLQSLAPADRAPFAAKALAALSTTIDNDRLAAFDAASGLYTGEESFLDWRDQTYAAWIPDDLASMASAKALSTNVGHYKALTVASSLARAAGDTARARRYAGWAHALKRAINTRLWLDDAGMYSSLTAGHFDGAPLHKFDWLGQSLAIVTGIADEGRARRILASYPHGPMGAPVIWPQQPGQPVYHNRAMWPFVAAYGLRAAIVGRNVAVADAAVDTLVRGAALNLSNMENLEWLTGQPLLLDEAHPERIGPVINSKRQLWSVGAYLGMVVRDVFGVGTTDDGLQVAPFVTAHVRSALFGSGATATLAGLRAREGSVDVVLHLPPVTGAHGYYTIDHILADGQPAGPRIPWSRLRPHSRIDVTLGRLVPGDTAIRRVNADPYAQPAAVFGPREPVLAGVVRTPAGNVLAVDAADAGATVNVWRDGALVASHVPPGAWTDAGGAPTACYALEAVYPASGNRSHHSQPRCAGAATAVTIAAGEARVHASARLAAPDARFAEPHLARWGKPDDRFDVDDVQVPADGRYAVQVRYHNGANQVNLGISGGVKWLSVLDARGAVIAQGVVQLPHAKLAKANTPTVFSTPLAATLKAGAHYLLRMTDFYNMSYLQSNSTFSAAGGIDGPSNRFDIYGLRLLRLR